jgi:phosphoribosyl 1,2-cyclic phosphate phosphodiesterase
MISNELQGTITILGCGTSTGVPVPGCKCEVCTSDDPKNSRLRTSAYLTLATGEGVLIDASPDLRQQALRHNLSRVDSVFYTHAHADHILGTDDLRVFSFKRSAPIPCYGNSETLAQLQQMFDYIFNPDPRYRGGLLAKLTQCELSPDKPFELFGVTFHPFELSHGGLPVLGFRVGNLSYVTDCNEIPDAARKIIHGSEILFIDGLRHEPHPTHNTIEQAVEAALSLGAKQTYLIHMTHNIDYAREDSALPDGINLAYDGLQVSFKV